MDRKFMSRTIGRFSNRSGKFSLENYFSLIYHQNLFNGLDSRSGEGSDLKQTEIIRREIPKIVEEFKITSIGDLPCGDFYWMSKVNLSNVLYRGYDIAPKLISELNLKYGNSKFEFQQLNVVSEIPKQHDLIICRDLLVHLSFNDAKRAVENIKKSGSKYLLTTTFPSRTQNVDLVYNSESVGWYPINLDLPPFNLSNSIRLINENCSEAGGLFADKSLALFELH
jgi:hypothetical protein